MSAGKKVVRLAVKNPPLEIMSYQQVRDQDFDPIPQRVGQPPYETLKADQDKFESFGVSVRMALATLGKTKAELIEDVRRFDKEHGHEGTCALLASFTDGAEMGELLLHFVKSAEIRIAVALHNIYDDEGRLVPAS
jgi:hypothetical protein